MRSRPGLLLLLLVSPWFLSSSLGAHRRHSSSSTAGTARLARQIAALLATPEAAQAHWGISITDMDGRVLYEKNDAQLFAPASNAKLTTTSTALALLGPETTITTRVIANAAPDAQGTVQGDVSVVGAGDAGMSGRAYPYDGRTERPNAPLNALEALADQVQQRGVKRIEGNIVGDDTAFPWTPYGSGWAWDDLEWSWGAPVSALTVNDNIAFLAIAPGAGPGEPLTYSWTPDAVGAYYTVTNEGRTSAAGSQASLGLDRPLGSKELRIFGTLPAGGGTKHLALAIQDPAEFAAIAFRQMLRARGITVTGNAVARHRASNDTAVYEQSVLRPLTLPASPETTPGTLNGTLAAAAVPVGAVVLAVRQSVPLLEDITVTNKVSQNLHAEILLRLLGRQFGGDGSIVEGDRVVRAFLERAGVQPGDMFFYDGSGLSPDDRITPRALTALLRYVAAQPWGAQFRSTLPVGGVDGTLDDRFLHGRMRGKVFAKTGTLDEVNALSGYVETASGRTLVFSILCNGHLPTATGITKTMDAIVTDAAQDSVR